MNGILGFGCAMLIISAMFEIQGNKNKSLANGIIGWLCILGSIALSFL